MQETYQKEFLESDEELFRQWVVSGAVERSLGERRAGGRARWPLGACDGSWSELGPKTNNSGSQFWEIAIED